MMALLELLRVTEVVQETANSNHLVACLDQKEEEQWVTLLKQQKKSLGTYTWYKVERECCGKDDRMD